MGIAPKPQQSVFKLITINKRSLHFASERHVTVWPVVFLAQPSLACRIYSARFFFFFFQLFGNAVPFWGQPTQN